jgi:protein TonB
MKKLLLLAALCCLFATTRAQTTDTVKTPPLPANAADPDNSGTAPDPNDKIYTSVTNPPHFTGGMDSLHRYLSKKMTYPPALLKAHKGGRVVVRFVVEKDGSLTAIPARLSPDARFSAEVLKAFAGLHFINGSQNGNPLRVAYSVVVRFDPDYPGVF